MKVPPRRDDRRCRGRHGLNDRACDRGMIRIGPETGSGAELGLHVGRREEPRVGHVEVEAIRSDRRRLAQHRGDVDRTPVSPALLEHPPTGGVAKKANTAQSALLVAEPGALSLLRGFYVELLSTDDEPGAARYERFTFDGTCDDRRRGVMAADEMDWNTAPATRLRAYRPDLRKQFGLEPDGITQLG